MVKIQIKSEKLTPFGGIFSIMEQFNSTLSSYISALTAAIRSTMTSLNANNQVANNRHARAITRELLVCRFCIILLSFYELMVEINITHLTLFQLTRCKYTIEQ